MKQIITSLMLLFSISSFSQDILGKWSGTIESGNAEPVVFYFTFEKKGESYTTTIDIPALRVANLKPKETAFSNNALLVDGTNIGFKYQGTFNQNLQQIEGTFTEGGKCLAITT